MQATFSFFPTNRAIVKAHPIEGHAPCAVVRIDEFPNTFTIHCPTLEAAEKIAEALREAFANPAAVQVAA